MNDAPFIPGLKPTPDDGRDFHLGGPFGITELPALTELPETFLLKTLAVKDQGKTDFCTAFATDLLNEINEDAGVELCPEWGFAASKALSGDPDEYGQDIRTALKRHVELGALPKTRSPYSLANKDEQFLRHIENWPFELKAQATGQKEKSFMKITGPYDHFDNIRASIWKFRNEKRAVVMGINWKWILSQYRLTNGDGSGFGHAIASIGWDQDGLILQNSAGLAAGVRGCHVMDRQSVNFFVEAYNAYMLIGLPKEDVKYMLENNIKLGDNWIVQGFKAFASLFIIIWKLCRK